MNLESNSYFKYRNQLCTTGRLYHKKRDNDVSYQFKKYRTFSCLTCAAQHLCTGRHDGRREIERSEYAEYVERNKENHEANASLYRQRQEINEHIFGTIKRQWNMYYTNLRGLEKVNGEVALIMLVYNMKRVRNILGFDNLMEKLHQWTPKYPGGTIFIQKRLHLLPFKTFIFPAEKICT